MFQYNCFLGGEIEINNGRIVKFPEILNEIHYGQKFIHFKKNIGNIKMKLSNGREFLFNRKKAMITLASVIMKKKINFI